MTELVFSSLLALSIGSLLCLPFISVREIGRGFFTLWGFIIGALMLIALMLRGAGLAAAGPSGGRAAIFLLASLVLLASVWASLRWSAPKAAASLLIVSALCGALALREVAMSLANGQRAGVGAGELTSSTIDLAGAERGIDEAADRGPAPARLRSSPARELLQVTSYLLASMAVGAVTVTMVLGHWYLVQPRLSIAPLRRLCDVLIGILLARLGVSVWGLSTSLAGGYPLLSGADPLPWEALILSQRLLFGFGGSLLLGVMIRKTVALRSTMSATGLLYIAILFVWVGEFLALYLVRSSGGGLIV